MNKSISMISVVLVVFLGASCEQNQTERKGAIRSAKLHQDTLDCPSGLDQYCGGWDVLSTNIVPADEHIMQHENFVIGKKNTGANQKLALFPRGNLRIRWNTNRVDLEERPSGGPTECLVGRVKIDSHSGGHTWHGITLRVDVSEITAEIGDEDELVMCLTVQQGGGWPSDCAPIDCEYEDSDDPRQHGGRAHSYD